MNPRVLKAGILFVDLFWIYCALFVADALRFGITHIFRGGMVRLLEYQTILALSVLSWLFLYRSMKLDGFRGGWNFPAMLSQLTTAVSALFVVTLSGAYLRKEIVSRIVIFHYAWLLLFGFVFIRYFAKQIFRSRYLARVFRRVVILGKGQVAQEVAHKIGAHPESLFEVVGFLRHPGNDSLAAGAAEAAAVGGYTLSAPQLVDFLQELRIHELLVAMEGVQDRDTKALIEQCQAKGIGVSLVPPYYQLYCSKPAFMELDGVPIISLPDFSVPLLMVPSKRTVDLLMAGLFCFLSLPLFCLVAISFASRGRRLFVTEPRAGRAGLPFGMLRLNTPVGANAKDRNRLDKFLVHYSFTELPQLWNVLLGDMSLVGPRPESIERSKHYSNWERLRLNVAPGITGLAQVHGLREQSSSQEKTRFDLQYILEWSLLLDISLILQTIWTLLRRKWHKESVALTAIPQIKFSVGGVSPQGIEFKTVVLAEDLVHADRSQSRPH